MKYRYDQFAVMAVTVAYLLYLIGRHYVYYR